MSRRKRHLQQHEGSLLQRRRGPTFLHKKLERRYAVPTHKSTSSNSASSLNRRSLVHCYSRIRCPSPERDSYLQTIFLIIQAMTAIRLRRRSAMAYRAPAWFQRTRIALMMSVQVRMSSSHRPNALLVLHHSSLPCPDSVSQCGHSRCSLILPLPSR